LSFYPFPFFLQWLPIKSLRNLLLIFGIEHIPHTEFPYHKLVELLSALGSISCMIILGFVDDSVDLRWRHKVILPTIASLPLLIVYMLNIGSTHVVVPIFLRSIFGRLVNLGVFYYGYMALLALYCTNAINILAGINGIEAGQSFVIALSILIHNLLQLNGPCYESHLFSLYIIIPFILCLLPLLYYNWYPSEVFVGDTFCYFAGMTFAVVGILGHFSKTMLLFFIPQIINTVYSMPQLLPFIPCPRHRLPKYNKEKDIVGISTVTFDIKKLNILGRLLALLMIKLHLVRVVKKTRDEYEINNLTLINVFLLWSGPMHEERLTTYLLIFQGLCSIIAFIIRYGVVYYFYDATNPYGC